MIGEDEKTDTEEDDRMVMTDTVSECLRGGTDEERI